jgi:hypothetical protein
MSLEISLNGCIGFVAASYDTTKNVSRDGGRGLRGPMYLTALVLALLGATSAGEKGASFRVIVHPSSLAASIGREELSRIFLRKQLAWRHGEAALPVDQRPSSPIREAFTAYVHRSEAG